MSKKLTPWFHPNDKPSRTGVYETEGDFYQHWNGEFWGYRETTVEDADLYGDRISGWQFRSWRGLAKAPK